MKGLPIILASFFFLISAINVESAESWVFKKPSAYYIDSKLLSGRTSMNLLKLTTSEDSIKKDSIPNEVSSPNVYLKLEWDTEKPIPYTQLGEQNKEKEHWQMMQFFLLLKLAIP